MLSFLTRQNAIAFPRVNQTNYFPLMISSKINGDFLSVSSGTYVSRVSSEQLDTAISSVSAFFNGWSQNSNIAN